jgi:hypothetical protein
MVILWRRRAPKCRGGFSSLGSLHQLQHAKIALPPRDFAQVAAGLGSHHQYTTLIDQLWCLLDAQAKTIRVLC